MKRIMTSLLAAVCTSACFSTPVLSQALKFETGTKMEIKTTIKRWKKATRRTRDSYIYQGYRGGVHIFMGQSSNGDALLLELSGTGDIKRFRRGDGKLITYPSPGLSAILPNQRGSWGKWENCVSTKVKRQEFKTTCTGRVFGEAATGQNIGTLVVNRDATNGFWFRLQESRRGRKTNTLMGSTTLEMTTVPTVIGSVPGF